MHATLYGVGVGFHAHGFRPALDRRQRCPQFMGHRGDELVLHVLRVGEFVCHLVDGHTEVADLVAAVLLNADRKISLGVFLGRGIDLLNGTDNRAYEIQSGHHQQQQHAGTQGTDTPHIGIHCALDLFQRSHHPNGVVFRVHIGNIHGDCHNGFTALLADPVAVAAVHDGFIIRHGGTLRRCEAGGGQCHPSTGIDRHEFHFVLVGKVFDGAPHFRGKVDVRVLCIAAQDTGHGTDLRVQILLRSTIIIVLHDVDKREIQHCQHQCNDPQIVDDPAAGDRTSGTFFRAASAFICHSTYIHNPRSS